MRLLTQIDILLTKHSTVFFYLSLLLGIMEESNDAQTFQPVPLRQRE